MPRDENAGLREVLRGALGEAVGARDRAALAALRSALAAIANAEAVDATAARPGHSASQHFAGSAAGLGAGDVPRRVLSETELRDIVGAEVAERQAAARQYAAGGHCARARDLEYEAAVLRAALDLASQGRALTFGAVAEAYERFRPGYPAELFDMVMAFAGHQVSTALEIGAGTGKATRLFAQRGVAVTATEPDGAMLAELRKHVPASVRTVQAAFEDLRPGEEHELVYVAAALHWTNPEGRWSRMAALLEPGGVFASFGGPLRLADPAVEEAVRAARAPFLDSDEVPSPDGTPPGQDMQWPGTELQRSEWFTGVQQSVIERRLTMSARYYVGYLSTISAYLVLPAQEQAQVFSQIMRALPEQVEVAADITVHLARRRHELE